MNTRDVTVVNGWGWRWRANGINEFQRKQGRSTFLYEFDQRFDKLKEGNTIDDNRLLRASLMLDVLAERLSAERLRAMNAIVDVRKKERRGLPEVSRLLNHITAVVVGYQQAVTEIPHADPLAVARAEERLECFLEELERMTQLFIPAGEDGLHPLIWDQRRFLLKPTRG